jgi:hypothetical protein
MAKPPKIMDDFPRDYYLDYLMTVSLGWLIKGELNLVSRHFVPGPIPINFHVHSLMHSYMIEEKPLSYF